jgi:hypothetical protein
MPDNTIRTNPVLETLSELKVISARIEERVEDLQAHKKEMQLAVLSLRDYQQTLSNRIAVIESRKIDEVIAAHTINNRRLDNLERSSASDTYKWEKIFDIAVKIAVALAVAFLFWKLGLK